MAGKITEWETEKAGVNKNFEVEGSMPEDEKNERILRNNIISSIRQACIDSKGNGRDVNYFPTVIYLGKDVESIKLAVNRYKELRKQFIKRGYEGIKIYDEIMHQATENVILVGLEQKKLLEGIALN